MYELERSDWGRRLRELLVWQGRSVEGVERQLGWSRGSLERLLTEGPPALKREHVRDILAALGAAPWEPKEEPAPPARPPVRDLDLPRIRDLVSRVVRGEVARHEAEKAEKEKDAEEDEVPE